MPITRESIIQNLYSTTAAAVPDSNLQLGEIAINAVDEAVFIKNSGGTVKKLSATSDLTSNFVTLSTTQTVSGDKNFSGTVTLNNGLVFEGVTADNFETTLGVVDPTADRAINLPNLDGTVGLVPGSDTQVVYNNGGALGANSNFTYDAGANTLEVDGGHVRSSLLGAVQIEVRNQTGSSIPIGTPIYATGYSGGRILIAPADASDSAKMPAIGVTDAAIGDATNGNATVTGILRNVNTTGYSINNTVYVASGGGLTNVRPTSASVLVQNMGKVVSVGSNGEIVVFGPGRSNDVPNTINVNGTVVFEGATADDFETTLTVVDPTSDQTITLPNSTGTVALTNNKLSVFASTTSSELAGVISDETGSGALVFGTSPTITTSMVAGGASFDLVNTIATTVNFAGAATTLSIGAATGTATINNANTVVTGDLAVNGGDITTTSTGTATVFNTNATALDLGGSAASITMGNSSTATTTVRGGTLVGNTATQSLFNTTATTLNLGGAATAITMGDATSATTTIRGGTLVGNLTTQNLFNTVATTLNLSLIHI